MAEPAAYRRQALRQPVLRVVARAKVVLAALRVPDDYDNTHPYRLIIAYHWLNGNANQVANGGMGGSTEKPYYGLWDLAEGSTIFVAPEGLDAGSANSGGRDLTLTDVILAQVQGDLCIDKTRIFATGFSYGAGMSYAIACARADVFRGVALYAGAQLSGCTGGTTPIAYFHAHGISDSVLDISQGRTLRDRYVMVNGCTSQNPRSRHAAAERTPAPRTKAAPKATHCAGARSTAITIPRGKTTARVRAGFPVKRGPSSTSFDPAPSEPGEAEAASPYRLRTPVARSLRRAGGAQRFA